MKKRRAQVLFFALLFLTGCRSQTDMQQAEVTVNGYEKITYETAEVERGDIEPVVELKLISDTYERKSYFPAYDGMTVDEVFVEAGDSVAEGDVLISFWSGDIEEQIEGYEDRIEENILLIDHYTRLQQIDGTDYSEDISHLKEDNEIAKLYIEELNTTLDHYSIRAEHNGSVVTLSSLLDYGVVNTQDNLITMIYGSGEYTAQTSDDYEFEIGQKFTATYSVASYEVELVSIEETGTDAEGRTLRKLTFQATKDSADTSSRDRLNVTVKKPALKNVLYIPEDAVFTVDDREYVYLLDENGFRFAREIAVRDVVDGYAVVGGGLEEGDRVVVNK